MRAALIALILMFGSPASAGYFLNKKAEWDKLNFEAKHHYAIGIFDGLFIVWLGDTDSWQKRKKVISKCAVELELTPKSLVDILDIHYQELDNWEDQPRLALCKGLLKVCKSKLE